MGCFFSRNAGEDEIYDMSPIRHLPVIFVNGVPGAGNQTVAQTISDITGYTMIRPGELVRAEAEKDTPRGRLVAEKLQSQEDIPEVDYKAVARAIVKRSSRTIEDDMVAYAVWQFLYDAYFKPKAQLEIVSVVPADTPKTPLYRSIDIRVLESRLRDNALVFDVQLTVNLIKEALLLSQDAKGFILVGFPKNPRMSNMFSRQVKWPEKIVALEVDDEVAASRLQKKLSELGRPESEISAARQIVKDAAHKVKHVHKRFGRQVVTVDSSGNPKALATTLKEVLADTIEKSKKEECASSEAAPAPGGPTGGPAGGPAGGPTGEPAPPPAPAAPAAPPAALKEQPPELEIEAE